MNSAEKTIYHLAGRLQVLLIVTGAFYGCDVKAAETDDPIVGTWLLVPSQSVHSDAAQSLERAFARYEPADGGAIRFTSEIHRKDGGVIRRGWTAKPDGNDHPVSGDPGFDMIALRRVNRHTILFLYKKGSS